MPPKGRPRPASETSTQARSKKIINKKKPKKKY